MFGNKLHNRGNRGNRVIQGLVSERSGGSAISDPKQSKAYGNVILTLFWFIFPFLTTPIKFNLTYTTTHN